MEFNPAFIDVTYHREEYEYVETKMDFWKNGGKKDRELWEFIAAIQNKYGVDAVPYFVRWIF